MKNKITGIIFGLFLVAIVVTPTWGAFVSVDQGSSGDALGLNRYIESLADERVNSDITVTNGIATTAQAITVAILGEPGAEPGGSGNGAPDIFGDDIFNSSQRRNTGAVGQLGFWIGEMYKQPPANTQTYIADVLNSANIATPAYAQGLGFQSLNPILETWKTFRNMAYTFFVLVFLVVGFLIMTRRKIGGQVVVTAQQAIPQVIIALLAVTFSYAIAGLLIDIMYITMYLLVGLFNGSESLISMSFFEFTGKLVVGGAGSSFDAVSEFVQLQLGDNIIGVAGGFLSGIGVAVVIAVAILFAVFSLFFELLKTYVSIVLSVALAPLILMVGAIPGRQNFGRWLNDLFGNLMAFPTVLLILLMFDKMTGGLSLSGHSAFEDGGFSPPYLFGLTGSQHIVFMLGVGMILIMTELVKQSKKAFGVKGGLFEQFAGSATAALSKGWKGGQLIPGVGATDTSKIGLSGKQILRAGAVQAPSIPVGAIQSYRAYNKLRSKGMDRADSAARALSVGKSEAGSIGARIGAFTGSNLYKNKQEELKRSNNKDKES